MFIYIYIYIYFIYIYLYIYIYTIYIYTDFQIRMLKNLYHHLGILSVAVATCGGRGRWSLLVATSALSSLFSLLNKEIFSSSSIYPCSNCSKKKYGYHPYIVDAQMVQLLQRVMIINLSYSTIQYYPYLLVSKKRGTPKSSIFMGVSIINHSFGGSPFMEPPISIHQAN